MSRQRAIDTTVGEWSWSHANFSTKYTPELNTGCWLWTGAYHSDGALFGAYKNGKAQMTQARRLSYMQYHNTDVRGKFVESLCNNLQCVNPQHHVVYTPMSRVDSTET
jgi:hypothetical protein